MLLRSIVSLRSNLLKKGFDRKMQLLVFKTSVTRATQARSFRSITVCLILLRKFCHSKATTFWTKTIRLLQLQTKKKLNQVFMSLNNYKDCLRSYKWEIRATLIQTMCFLYLQTTMDSVSILERKRIFVILTTS